MEKSLEQIEAEWQQILASLAKIWKNYSKPERTEALRLARDDVKAALKREGIRVSYVEASMITKGAKALLTMDRRYLRRARRLVTGRP
jgi:hypothetical protein